MSSSTLLTVALAGVLSTAALQAVPRFELGLRLVEAPEMGTITNRLIHTDSGTFAFMAPPLWRMDAIPGEAQVSFRTSDYSRISIRLDEQRLEPNQVLSREALRTRLLQRLPESRLLDEGTLHSEAESGPWFEVAWRDPVAGPQHARMAYIAFDRTVFEFSLLGPPDQLRRCTSTFQDLVTSFQVLPR